MATFEQIWERNGRWFMGPGLLGDIIEHLRGKSPIVVRGDVAGHLNLQIPLPMVRDEITGNLVNIFVFVPEELRALFANRCSRIMMDWYDEDVDAMIGCYLHREKVTPLTLNRFGAGLAAIEQRRVVCGETALWQIAAETFGFSQWALPKPAGLVRAA